MIVGIKKFPSITYYFFIGNPTGSAMPSLVPPGSGVPPGAPPQGTLQNVPIETQVSPPPEAATLLFI